MAIGNRKDQNGRDPQDRRMSTAAAPVVDGMYSWVILMVAFLLNLTLNAAAGGMGVIMVELMHTFQVRKSVIFWVGGILVSVGFLLSFLTGWLIKRFGCRLTGIIASLCASASLILASFTTTIAGLYATYGFMLGISTAFYWNIASVIVQQYFEKRRTLAQGTLMSGLSGGLFIWPPVTRYIMDIYGWRGAMIIHAGIQLHGVVLCALIRPFPKAQVEKQIYRPIYRKPQQTESVDLEMLKLQNGGVESDEANRSEQSEQLVANYEQNNGKQSQNGEYNVIITKSDKSACNCGAQCFRALFKVLIIFPHYLLYMLAVTMVQMGNVMPYTLTPARADALGIDRYKGALIVTITAGVSGICRILCGLIADHRFINRLVFCGVAGLVAGTLTALSTVLTSFVSLAVTFAIIGVPSAAFMSTFGSAAVDIVGKKYVQQAVGLMSVSFGIAQLSTFLGTGWINDLLGDPKWAFLMFGTMEACGGVVFIAVYFVDRRFRRNLVSVPATTENS